MNGDRVGTLYHRVRDPNTRQPHQPVQYPNAPHGSWRLVLTGEDVSDGRYHAWLERDPGCKVCQALFTPAHAEYSGTTGSICNGMQTIAVGAYDAHDPAQNVAPFSSSGPTRDGRVRPVLLAPGVRVLAARSHPRQGTASLLTRMSGTSMAAPHVAGTIALMLEAGGRLDIVQIRRALFESLPPSARRAARPPSHRFRHAATSRRSQARRRNRRVANAADDAAAPEFVLAAARRRRVHSEALAATDASEHADGASGQRIAAAQRCTYQRIERRSTIGLGTNVGNRWLGNGWLGNGTIRLSERSDLSELSNSLQQ